VSAPGFSFVEAPYTSALRQLRLLAILRGIIFATKKLERSSSFVADHSSPAGIGRPGDFSFSNPAFDPGFSNAG